MNHKRKNQFPYNIQHVILFICLSTLFVSVQPRVQAKQSEFVKPSSELDLGFFHYPSDPWPKGEDIYPPNQPTIVHPLDNALNVATSPSLEVNVSHTEAANMTVTFYGRALPAQGSDFTIIALPDTQHYTANLYGGSPEIFNAQTQWIKDAKDSMNIVFVTHLGDVVQHGDDENEWLAADITMTKLEDLVLDGIPYGVAVGNHDQSPEGNSDDSGTILYNQFFGESRFSRRSYYGGHYGSNNDNNYQVFSAGGMEFIAIHLEYDTSPNVEILDWADNLLQIHSNRRGIVITHNLINTGGYFSIQGQAIYDALKDNSNLFLMHGGHILGEGRREDIYNGNTVYSILADYQHRTNGGDGWLRTLTFSPTNNEIQVKTYSPTLDLYETDSDSQFVLSYQMQDSFQQIGQTTNVLSGSNTNVIWPGLAESTAYEWYVTVNDGNNIITGEIWSFSTVALSAPPEGLTIILNGSTLELGWRHIDITSVDHFEIWRSLNTPYFDPSDPGCNCGKIADVTTLNYNDYQPGGIGNIDNNYYYMVRAFNGAGTSDFSNTVGEVDFPITSS